MPEIKNVVFDLGGVLIDIDYNRTIDSFKQLGFKHFEEMYSQFKANQLFENLETGKIDERTFYLTMIEIAPNSVTRQQITDAWNAMLGTFRIETLDFIQALRKQYRVFLLSNTNIIHKRKFDEIFREQTGLHAIDPLFDKCYYSHLVGMRKPNRNIYRHVLSDGKMEARETLFIDDTQPNVDAARELGIVSEVLSSYETVDKKYNYLISS